MAGYALRFRLLPLAALLCGGACLTTEGYYRYQDGGPSGAAGVSGTAGDGGGVAGSTGSAGSTGGGAVGTAGTAVTSRGGTTGTAGTTGRGGTTGAGGTVTTGRGGTTGSGGSGAVLFADDFEGTTLWDWQGEATHGVVLEAGTTNHAYSINSVMSKQSLAAYTPTGATSNHSIEARMKVLSWNGSSSSYVGAICARLSSASSFYYLAIQSNDSALKFKYNNGSNSSIGSSMAVGFALNAWIRLKLVVVGNTLTAYLYNNVTGNWDQVGQETDTNIATGTSIGLMAENANVLFDDVVVRAAP